MNYYKSKLKKIIKKFRKEECQVLSRFDKDPNIYQNNNYIDLSYLFLKIKTSNFTNDLLDLIEFKGEKLNDLTSEQLKDFTIKRHESKTKVIYDKKSVMFDWTLDHRNTSFTYNRGNEYIHYVKKTGNSFYTFESFNINLVTSLSMEYNSSGLMAMKISNMLNIKMEDLFLSIHRINLINKDLFIEFKDEKNKILQLKVEEDILIIWSYDSELINKIFNPTTHNFTKILQRVGE